MSSKRNPKPATPPSDAEFEKAWREGLRSIGPESGVDFHDFRKHFAELIWREAQEAQMERDFDIAFVEDAVAGWEIRRAFNKRRGIHNVPG